jgi:hypothetical protein
MDAIRKQLEALADRPAMSSPAYAAWLEQKEPLAFLVANAREDDLVVYAVGDHIFVHTVFAPARAIKTPDVDDLLNWNGNAYTSWGMCTTYKPKKHVYIEPPLGGMGSKVISAGEQLLFVRDFDGSSHSRSYIELLQKFVHVSDIHFVQDRDAWCTLDDNGDLKDLARIVKLPPTDTTRGGQALIVNRRLLDRYALMTGAAMIRMFDFTHFTPSRFSSWETSRNETTVNRDGLMYRQWIQSDASFAHGVQSISPRLKPTDLLADYGFGAKRKTKQYASFIAYDWKNNRVGEISCSPDALANYFTKSDKPYEITPAFFRPEVLLRYKADTTKYTVESRSIRCRGAWHLQTYDINELGQVHTYLVYLSRLPYEEQLYWRSFNEQPKGPISKRAYTTDFKGGSLTRTIRLRT